jgi:purine-binding chemotaxis protein CheW
MLVDSTADIVTAETTVRLDKAKLTSEYDLTKPFQALLFDINRLQLAIRTEDIKAILPWPETPLEQSQESSNNKAIIGSYNLAANQIKIINTVNIVLPIQHRRSLAIPSFMIVVGEGNWALSSHKINSVIILAPEEMRWRKNKGTRPWLAGTSIENSCSIVNLTELVSLLNP